MSLSVDSITYVEKSQIRAFEAVCSCLYTNRIASYNYIALPPEQTRSAVPKRSLVCQGLLAGTAQHFWTEWRLLSPSRNADV